MAALPPLLLILALAVLLAKAAGWISTRLGQPAVLGELLVGLVLGPSVLNLFHWPLFSGGTEEVVILLAELGVIMLMLIAGLEVDLRELRRAGRSALLAGILGVVLPLLGGWGLTLLWGPSLGYDSTAAFAVGVLLTATSVSISAQTLLELGVLRSPEGIALLGAAVVDDVLVILILSLEVAFLSSQVTLVGILLIVGRMALFLGVGGVLCLWGLPRLMSRVERWPISAAVPAAVLVATFFTAWAAEFVGGVAAITGAFLAGLGLRRSPQHHKIVEAIHSMGYALFVPLFFVSVGLQANVRALDGRLLLFAGALILVAIVTKVLGSGLGAWLGGFKPPSAFRVGLGMISRGEVGLIVAAVEIREGWLDESLFAVMMLLVLASTIVTPLLLKWAFRSTRATQSAAGAPPARSSGEKVVEGKS
jgi:Kef-type K+ transport system membrane component KefB